MPSKQLPRSSRTTSKVKPKTTILARNAAKPKATPGKTRKKTTSAASAKKQRKARKASATPVKRRKITRKASVTSAKKPKVVRKTTTQKQSKNNSKNTEKKQNHKTSEKNKEKQKITPRTVKPATDAQVKKAFEGTRNILLTGEAGTGKSWLIRKYVEEHPNTIVCAPTGIAAVNIGGSTVHQAFGVPVPCLGVRVGAKQKAAIRTLALADTVIIDEISMCRADVFSFLIRVLKHAEKKRGKKIRLIVSGDFSQLPPVMTKNDISDFRRHGLDISGYPFTTKEWADCHFKVVLLSDIKRQSDKEFIAALNEVRAGHSKGIKYFNDMVIPDAAQSVSSPDSAQPPLPAGILSEIQNGTSIYICGTNAEAERINQFCISQLTTVPYAYQSISSGHIGKDSLPMDSIVLLKEGERVMFTVNDLVTHEYQNGTLGVITGTYSDHVSVLLETGKAIAVGKHQWVMQVYKGSTAGEVTQKTIGTFSQIPLKPAYAITIHKSQGKTFDSCIVAPRAFAPGQLYVALSRCRMPEGLKLTSAIEKTDLVKNGKVAKFIKNGYQWGN